MAIGRQTAVLDGVRRIFEGGTAAASGPDSLLRRFARTEDEAAFAAIVARHGPMVLAVCRRALRDPHEVEDAFQATFLVFVRRAGSIRDGDALGAWLHGVARRVAVRARARAARRRERKGSSLGIEPAATADDPDRTEVVAVVDEEIDRLPERYRRAIVLCDLEGCTQPEAAGRLGWTEGSVRGRLARGREMLKSRLSRRGLVAPAGAIGGLAAADAASAARLGEKFVGGLTRFVGRSAAVGETEVTANAVALAREVVGVVMRQKLLVVGVLAFAAGAAITGAGVAGTLLLNARGRQTGEPPLAEAPKARRHHADAILPEDAAPSATDSMAGPEEAGVAKLLKPPEPLDNERLTAPVELPAPGLLPPLRSLDDLAKPPEPEPADARRIAVGDVILIEVLQALPGRPITGERLVRPDGTVSLG
ncbi:MAG TPA: sigma-70 family RNA polymerase sigma factor, partial [Isosphaeraceae bacterium]